MMQITSREQLREVYPEPKGRTVRKVIDHLEEHCRAFIALSPFVLLSTAGADGKGDVTPRGDAPGFVAVLDDNTLAIPDRPGNNRLDSLQNVIENPEVGLLFLVPGFMETLRINGTAQIRTDQELCQRFAVAGRLPPSVLVVTVREAFLHCAKSIMRSRLWDADAQVERSLMPTIGQIISDQLGESRPVETQDQVIESYRPGLY
ncbi:MAG: pyridoxamine 5'-phosphate oxidase family protein [Proteobacteria bacterium]|nr:pyridoxamine 5'-phosphate oxidase family protein [Pseudomonadota bacterium]MDA1071447.1 pyridoxamine 5'-phosphate oxidase family protein [Pseudomonadota bacterium]